MVVRQNKEILIQSDELVPGDLVIIPQICTLPCDMVLMSGQCVVNESILTGESFPVIKTPIQKGSIRKQGAGSSLTSRALIVIMKRLQHRT